MTKKNKFILVSVAFVMLFMYYGFFLFMENVVEVDLVTAIKGEINLENWDAQTSTKVLKGQWLYYHETLYQEFENQKDLSLLESEIITIPENKKFGNTREYQRYGTYRLSIKGLEANQIYGIYIGAQVTAHNLYANGNLVLSNGVVSSTEESHVSEWKPKVASVYSNEKGELELAVELSNYEYEDGLFWGAPTLGHVDNITEAFFNRRLIDSMLVLLFSLISIVILSMFFYFKLDRSLLYFAILTSLMAIRVSVTSTRPLSYAIKSLDWNILIRLEYWVGYLLLPIILMFTISIVEVKHRKIYRNIFLGIMLLITIFTFTMDHKVYAMALNVYYVLAVLGLIFCVGAVWVRYRGQRFTRYMFFVVIANFGVALIIQMTSSSLSYIPIALLNAIIGLAALLMDSMSTKIRDYELKILNSMIDPLTGLYNRKYLDELTSDANNLGYSKGCYVMFLDLDGFKVVNDVYGHEEGDVVLQIVSHRIRNSLKNEDTIIRYGGDEFIVLVNTTDKQVAEMAATRIIDAIKSEINHEDRCHRVGVSIGIVACNRKISTDINHYISLSDQAMYEGKTSGGNCYHFVDPVKLT